LIYFNRFTYEVKILRKSGRFISKGNHSSFFFLLSNFVFFLLFFFGPRLANICCWTLPRNFQVNFVQTLKYILQIQKIKLFGIKDN
jgi:hypothetical protein